MALPTYLIVGLGNPGYKFKHTRHNAGFDVLTLLSEKLGTPISRARRRSLIGETLVDDCRVILAQPQTYMNLSGEAVAGLLKWYRLQTSQMLVIYDDIDLPPGTLRIRRRGGPGTHNGMRSIIDQLGADSFPRIRVGVGQSPNQYDLVDWVLGSYHSEEERQVALAAYERAAEAAVVFVREGIAAAMSRFNPQKTPRPQKRLKEAEDQENSGLENGGGDDNPGGGEDGLKSGDGDNEGAIAPE